MSLSNSAGKKRDKVKLRIQFRLYFNFFPLRYGNLQRLLQKNRKLFVNQIDDFTGVFDPNEALNKARTAARARARQDFAMNAPQ